MTPHPKFKARNASMRDGRFVPSEPEPEPEQRLPHGWWILPGLVMGLGMVGMFFIGRLSV